MANEIQILNNGESLYDIRTKINENFQLVRKDVVTNKQITNCLLEVPQRIKLEVNNGTLTLKAGSEVTIPNGFEPDGITPKFDYEIIENDVVMAFQTASGNLIVYTKNVPWETSGNPRFDYFTNGDNMFSGASQPTTPVVNSIWYNTTTNKIMASGDFGATWTEVHCSLPLCIINSNASRSMQSIRQVFNAFGYIGSTVWVDRGITGLAPNGRNEDGTLNNVTWESTDITLETIESNVTHAHAVIAFNPNEPVSGHKLGVISMESYSYNELENKNYDLDDEFIYTPIAYATITNGVISFYDPKIPFRAAEEGEVVKMYDFASGKWQYDSTLDLHVLNTGLINKVGINVFKKTDLGGVVVEFVDIVETAEGVLTLHALDAFDGYLVFA